MSSKSRSKDEQTTLQSIEETTALLRRCPARVWVLWIAATGPFSACFLHFWNDMSRAASALERLPASSLVLAVAYWWMKVGHALFGDELLRLLRLEEQPPKVPARGWLRLAASQAMIHATMPWVLTLAMMAVLPAAWAYAFYHNVSILAVDHFRKGGRTRGLMREALKQAHYRPMQNHTVVSLAALFAFLVWLNFFAGTALVATLVRTFTGSENELTLNPSTFGNTGFFVATVLAAYMTVGPFFKAFYALRCFYGLSRQTGEDLLVRLRELGMEKPATAVSTGGVVTRSLAVVGVLALFQPASASAAPASGLKTMPVAPAPSPGITPSVDAGELHDKIRSVMQEDIFQWRLPREKAPEQESGWLAGFVRGAFDWLEHALEKVGDWFRDLFRSWFESKIPKDVPTGSPGTGWAETTKTVLIVLLILCVAILLYLIIKQWRTLKPAPAKADLAPPPEINLDSEHVVASQLPENEWLRLAQEKIDAGEYRLALRALFLATLAHLGERRLIAVARFKSNGDYVRELALRARDRSDLRGSFRESVRLFDWAWYGWHDVDRELLDQYRDNHQRIVSDGGA